MELPPETETRLNNELLNAEPAEAAVENEKKNLKKPKRNSKDDITKKILQIVEKYGLEFEYSDTKLRRMSKTELEAVGYCDGTVCEDRHGQGGRGGPSQ